MFDRWAIYRNDAGEMIYRSRMWGDDENVLMNRALRLLRSSWLSRRARSVQLIERPVYAVDRLRVPKCL